MDHQLLLDRARLAGQWLLANQVTRKGTADRGRYTRSVDIEHDMKTHLASSWLQGVGIKALLALHEATGDGQYLESCALAADYIRTLQQMDARNEKGYGYIVETHPQDRAGHPRDALTAAWALLLMHRANEDDQLLDRAMLFAEWFLRHGTDGEYPYWTVFVDGQEPDLRQRGSFHGGSPAFFCDLFEMTGDPRWLKLARKIADFHMANFLHPDGSLSIVIEADTGRDLTGTGDDASAGGADLAWEHMHKFNDDFTALAMMKLGELTEAEKYTEAGLRFARFLLKSQGDDGGFGDPAVPSAGPTGALTLFRAAQVDRARRDEYLAGVERSIDYTLARQVTDSDDPRLQGGFFGQSDFEDEGGGWQSCLSKKTAIHLRTHAYATSALAMLGGKCSATYYNVSCEDA